jgi:hypothetical protein
MTGSAARWFPRLGPLVGVLAALATSPGSAEAQYFNFGQNKIQYRRLDWHILRGEHVDLYYYPAEGELVPAALAYAEASYDTLAIQFGHEVGSRIPLIVYASHTDFEQTNVLPFTPPEGLLGVTDVLKRRVSLPFRGNFAEFRHTIRHEMVHVFQLDLLTRNYLDAPRHSRFNFPLWWSEGLAELWSGGQDARDEMVLRDLTMTGRLPPMQTLSYVTSPIVYPIGGEIHRWLADTYGDWRIPLIYKEQNRFETFEAAIKGVYGRSLEQLDQEFQLAMRRRYYPSVDSLAPLSVLGREVARLAVKPAYVPDSNGGQVAYLSPNNGYVAIYRRSLDGDFTRTVLTGGRNPEFEAFHAFDSRMDASRPGLLLFTARFGDRDALVIWDLEHHRVRGRYRFPGIVSLLSPQWMPDGRSIVLSGLSDSGVSDIYRILLPDGTIEPLTKDRYRDLDPAPSADGRRIVFTSDRTADGKDGASNLFLLDLQTSAVRQLTAGTSTDESPAWGPEGRIYFTSDRDGVLNVFSVDTLGNGRRETSSWSGAFDAVPLPDTSGLVVGGFHDLSWNLYRDPVDSAARNEAFALGETRPPGQWGWVTPGDTAGSLLVRREPYKSKMTMDFVAGSAVVVPGYGASQGFVFVMSDLLEDNQLYASIGSFQGRQLGSIVANINANAVYVNQARRLNWGVGAFRTTGRNFEGDRTVAYQETAAGGLGLIRYPISRFSRVDGVFTFEHSDRTDFTLPVDDPRRVGWIASHFLSYVHDASLYVASGPIDGGRYSITTGLSTDFTNSRFDSYLITGDWRKYLRLGQRSTWALRAYGFYSGGDRPRRTNLGGSLALRGYPVFGYIVGTQAYMLNHELRFPVLTHLTLGTPFGDMQFPEIQAAFYTDIGKANYYHGSRDYIGSYGISFRMAFGPLAVLRLDVGRRFSGDNFRGYALDRDQRKPSYVTFWIGPNF